MFIDKTIKFGYGTILVSASQLYRSINLKYIQPPKVVGKSLSEQDMSDVVILDELDFKYESDMVLLLQELNTINENNTVIEFRGYTLDFSNYNEHSIKTVKEACVYAIAGYQLALAC